MLDDDPNVGYWWEADVDAIAPIGISCRMNEQSLDVWPEHMRAVFARVGTLMGSKRLSPDLLVSLPEYNLGIVNGYRVTISHTPAAELGWKRGRYTVVITGPRIDGRWYLRPGQMEKLSREAALAIPDVR